MSSEADLVRIGEEGFAILDACLGNKGRSNLQKPHVTREPNPICLYRYQPQQARVCQVKPDEIMNSYEVLRFYEGEMVKDHTRKSQAMAY